MKCSSSRGIVPITELHRTIQIKISWAVDSTAFRGRSARHSAENQELHSDARRCVKVEASISDVFVHLASHDCTVCKNTSSRRFIDLWSLQINHGLFCSLSIATK